MRHLAPNHNPISLLKSSPGTIRILSVFLSLLILNLFTGCTYYRVKGIPEDDQKSQLSWLQEFNRAEKFIVIHQGEVSLHLQNALLDETTYELKGVPVQLPPEHTYEKPTEIGKGNRYKKWIQSPFEEVHLFINDQITVTPGQPLSIPITSIEQIGYPEKDTLRSVANVFGIVVGTLAIVSVIVALTKSSCPFIYVDDGGQWVFQGEIYPGNVYQNAQRTNYMKLPAIVERDGFYNIRITNELLEIQHTDEAVLEIVDHPNSITVASDPSGNIYSIESPQLPIKAMADDQNDILQEVIAVDGLHATFDTPMEVSDHKRKIDLWFENSANSTRGKFILTLKNSLWMDYVMGKFYEQFGDYFPEFQKKQQSISLEEAYQWREDQSLPLSVYVDRGNGWELQHKVYAVGPLKFQEIVLPMDLSGSSNDLLKVRLETGFMFWEVDKIAMDYSEQVPFKKVEAKPSIAVDNYNRNVTDLLSNPDQAYLTQYEVGDWVEIQYQSPPRNAQARTIFLRNQGYYTYVRDFKGDPDFAELRKFRNPGHFTAFAESQYAALIEAILQTQPEIVAGHE